MQQIVSKSQFKPQALQFLRQVEKQKKRLIITHAGKPVVQILPFSEDANEQLISLRGTVLKYSKPTQPVSKKDWEILK